MVQWGAAAERHRSALRRNPDPVSRMPKRRWRPHPSSGWAVYLVAAILFAAIYGALSESVGYLRGYLLSFVIIGPPFFLVQRYWLRSTYPAANVTGAGNVILYLRPFSADSTAYLAAERPIVQSARRYGTLVSLGEPNLKAALGTRMPRLEVEGEWQDDIRKALDRNPVVITYLAGTTPDLLWEIRAVASAVPPEQVIILVNADGTPQEVLGDIEPELREFVSRCIRVRVCRIRGGLDYWFRDRRAWNDYRQALDTALARVSTYRLGGEGRY